MRNRIETDVLIVGCGCAGLSLAIRLSDNQYNMIKITMISKDKATFCNTSFAQGGIAIPISKEDVLSHINDTIIAGDGECNRYVVNQLINEGRVLHEWTREQNISFDRTTDGNLSLSKEGGHSNRRIVHIADSTGESIEIRLLDIVKSRKNIHILENTFAVSIIMSKEKCVGMYVMAEDNEVYEIVAKIVVLATGGCSNIYKNSTNPSCATGDGIAIGITANCTIQNLEFEQFHPTCFYDKKTKSTRFLVTESMRGDRAYLIDKYGNRFMRKYHTDAELSTRDIVSRGIYMEMQESNEECVYLDISYKLPSYIKRRFRYVYEESMKYGYDITKEPIPVVPAAHYTCGGIFTDMCGRTGVHNLYAIGEVAYTGLHGANRLASNSMLEGLAMSKLVAEDISVCIKRYDNVAYNYHLKREELHFNPYESVMSFKYTIDDIKNIMWENVGIVKKNSQLNSAKSKIIFMINQALEMISDDKLTRHYFELRNILIVAYKTIDLSIERKRNVGTYYNVDI